MPTPSRPILRYHGGKWKLADWIISNFPPHRIYVEPFGGAASILIQKTRCYSEVYNDLGGELVNLFTVVRDRGLELVEALRLTPFAREEYSRSFELSEDSLEQARRTVVRSFMGFGSNALCRGIKSGFRSNSNRSGTTPAHDWANLPSAYKPIIERLRGVVLENRDAIEVILAHDSAETLIYADPPYVHSTRSAKMHGHRGYDFEMDDDAHCKLADVLHNCAGMVILSGYPCELYENLYSGWSFIERKAHADGALDRVERLWFNANTAKRLSQEVFDFTT
jgi:DNA adenine methylase